MYSKKRHRLTEEEDSPSLEEDPELSNSCYLLDLQEDLVALIFEKLASPNEWGKLSSVCKTFKSVSYRLLSAIPVLDLSAEDTYTDALLSLRMKRMSGLKDMTVSCRNLTAAAFVDIPFGVESLSLNDMEGTLKGAFRRIRDRCLKLRRLWVDTSSKACSWGSLYMGPILECEHLEYLSIERLHDRQFLKDLCATKPTSLKTLICGHLPLGRKDTVYEWSYLSALTALSIDVGRGINDTFLLNISSYLPKLSCLNLRSQHNSCSTVTDVGLTHLAQCKHLRSIVLDRLGDMMGLHEAPGDEGVINLAKGCTQIEELGLMNFVDLSDRGVSALIEHHGPSLTSVDVCGSSITDISLRKITQGCPKLSRLNIAGCIAVSGTGVSQAISKLGPQLVHLNLCKLQVVGAGAEGSAITDAELELIGLHCSKLESLDINDSGAITDGGIRRLLGLPLESAPDSLSTLGQSDITTTRGGCIGLMELVLSGCFKLTDAALEAIAERCSDMSHLDLADLPLVSDRGLRALASLSRVLFLRLDSERPRPNFTDQGIQSLLATDKPLHRSLRELNLPAGFRLSIERATSLATLKSLKRLRIDKDKSPEGILALRNLRRDIVIEDIPISFGLHGSISLVFEGGAFPLPFLGGFPLGPMAVPMGPTPFSVFQVLGHAIQINVLPF
eukprot:CAMPEP_0184646578 /NCGR_PEP_ID=MMETSP0308-20130426/3281_1 /TAXON_ID=38269 /ORGANISM="Gloeochaete witrockiana, Strain SAG 46.84" /LENGTH=671 /DNA_ID=CAMNT_0027076709 /DNA_START=36 /DNA_END=2051 /DNA_ORIENTATION=-